jgi:NADPH-dependent 7-cyano-7-deazaguanine reductase QueF
MKKYEEYLSKYKHYKEKYEKCKKDCKDKCKDDCDDKPDCVEADGTLKDGIAIDQVRGTATQRTIDEIF